MSYEILHDMFFLSIPWVEKIIRPIIVYFALVLVIRLAGKRELAQLNSFDLVVLLLLSNTVQNAIIGEDNSLIGGLIGAITLLTINNVFVRYVHKVHKLEHFFEGETVSLIDRGKLHMQQIDKLAISVDELKLAALRQGFSSLEEVETALLEPSGNIVFLGKENDQSALRFRELNAKLNKISHELDRIAKQNGEKVA